MVKCIWCQSDQNALAEEHIIPEPLGCPPDFVLKNGEVCKVCNSNLAHLDQAVLDDFDISTFTAGISRKGKRPPIISNRGNVVGKHIKEEKTIFINMEKYSVKGPNGTVIPPFGKSSRNIKASLTKEGDIGSVSFSQAFGSSKKFVRGIYKIAFESIVYFRGSEPFLKDEYDSIRDYVMEGIGERKIICSLPENKTIQHIIRKPYVRDKTNFAMQFQLLFIDFIVDLTPTMILFPQLLSEAKRRFGNSGRTYFPIDS